MFNQEMSRWVGIDFGTGSCSVAAHRNGAVEVIADEQGTRVTPSCVAFTDQDVVVGEAALSQAHSNILNTIFDIKFFLQHKFSALSEEVLKQWEFKVVAGANDYPAFEVQIKGKKTTIALEDLIGHLLNKMKVTSAGYLGEKVENAVITVPSAFTEEQREIVRKGATNAGFKQVRFIKDAVAAAMAHDLDMPSEQKDSTKTVLIVDFGAGSVDATVLRVDRGLLSVLASDSNCSVRGTAIDLQLLDHFAKEFEKKERVKISTDAKGKQALRKLRTAAEKAKRSLANQPQASLELDGLYQGRDFSAKLSKARFDAMTGSVVRKAMAVVLGTLQKAGVSKECVTQVLCVGGSSKLTKFQQAMSDSFTTMKQVAEVSSEEAVVVGAAEQANLFSGDLEKKETSPVACPRTIGVAVGGGVVFPMIKRGALLPASVTKKFQSKGASVLVDLYQGERVQAADLQQVAKFALSGEGTVELTLGMSLEGSLNVVAKQNGKVTKELKIEAKGKVAEEKLAEEATAAAKFFDSDLKMIEGLKLADKKDDEEDDNESEDDEGETESESESESDNLMDDLDDDMD